MSSISDSRKPDEAQLLPAYEALPREARGLSPDARRLFWSLNGPLTTSLWIMEARKMPESRKPYFRQTTGGDATTSLHPASQTPLTEPKVSSVTVSVDKLERWDEDWYGLHREHWDDIDPGTAKEFTDENGEITAAWGALPDFTPDEDEDGTVHLLKCCEINQPHRKAAKLVIKPDTSSGRDFVTIHNSVSAVHPWLIERREDILGAKGLVENDKEPLPSETKLMVDSFGP